MPSVSLMFTCCYRVPETGQFLHPFMVEDEMTPGNKSNQSPSDNAGFTHPSYIFKENEF